MINTLELVCSKGCQIVLYCLENLTEILEWYRSSFSVTFLPADVELPSP